ERIPDDVEIEDGLPGGGALPEQLRLTLQGMERMQGFATPLLVEREHGAWEGDYTFPDSGVQIGMVSLTGEDGRIEFEVGTIEVR
ncbi:MAG: hypothetical protein ACOC9Y_00405, partial [Chloroflexota bacterium]